ncbi:MAG: hypothetical protein EOO20_12570 [Chryseobacterium sp.]|nr:MAG: hypothetical protein EOO20_12570 [Chryseobacterium sp.]
MKRVFLLLFFFCSTFQLQAQQYGLFNTNTLFDGFENPAQKTFVLDSSRQFASNFLLPYFGLNAANKGASNYTFRRILTDGVFSARTLPLGVKERNTIFANVNTYLLTLKIYKSYKYQKELGFSWQVRNDGYVNFPNELIAIIDNYKRFENATYPDAFNTEGYNQSYHQFSITYRENLNKKLAFGVKASLLSGITYNKLSVTRSSFALDEMQDKLTVGINGRYQTNIFHNEDVGNSLLYPNFRNPGASISFGTSYRAKRGVMIIGNIKDLGLIRWNSGSRDIILNNAQKEVNNLSTSTNSEIEDAIKSIFQSADRQKALYTLTNAKADFLISKQFSYYKPSLIISKNLFYRGGDVAFVNSFKTDNFLFSVTPTYNMNGFLMAGLQALYKTPNFEGFIGSDNITKSVAIRQDADTGKGYNGASIYMGIAIKFGYIVEHPLNASHMPGVNDESRSFFKSIFGIFKKKR